MNEFDCRMFDSKLRSAAQLSTPFVVGPSYNSVTEIPAWAVGGEGGSFIEPGQGTDLASELILGHRGPEVVAISDKRFKRNKDWAKLRKWMGDRDSIAIEFADRSLYSVVRSYRLYGQPLKAEDIPATFGVTWAKFERKDFEGKSVAEVLAQPSKILPEEKSLGVVVARYYDNNGQGIAIEFRANSKARRSPEGIADETRIQMVQMVFEVMKNYPELYDKPIITAYADQAHRELYRLDFGFKVQEETTPIDKPIAIKEGEHKVDWWIIQSSPKEFEAQLFKLKGQRTLSINQPHPFKLWNGETAYSMANKNVSFDSNNHVTLAHLDAEAEVAPGVYATKGAMVWWENNKLYMVNELSRPSSVEIGDVSFQIPVSSQVYFDNLRKGSSRRSYLRYVYGDGHQEGTWRNLHLDKEGNPKPVEVRANKNLLRIPGIDVGASSMKIDYNDKQITLRVKETGDIGGGVFPELNSDLVLKREGNKWAVVKVKKGQGKKLP